MRKLFSRLLVALAALVLSVPTPAQQLQIPGSPPDFAGPTNVAVFLVYYQDTDWQNNPAQEFDAAAIAEIQNDLFGAEPSMSHLFQEMSFGTDVLTGTIIQVPNPIPYNGHIPNGNCGSGGHTNWAASVLQQMDPTGTIYSYQGSGGYDMLMFIYPRQNNCDGPYGGVNGVAHRVAYTNPNPQQYDELPYTSIFNWKVEQTMAHEVGHLKGWNHAQLEGYTGPGMGYGDHSCVMGDNYIYPNHPDYPIVVPNPQDPPVAQRIEMRHASAPMKIRAGYIDENDVYFASGSPNPQTIYLAPTEMDPASFPSPPGGAPIYHAAAIDFPYVDRSYVVSFRHQSLSSYNLDYPHLMGRVHVHTYGDTGDVFRRASLETGESYADDFLTVTAVSDGLAGENYVEVTIDVPQKFPAGLEFSEFVEESNDGGNDSQVIPIVVENRGPGNGSVTFALGLNPISGDISGATFTPAQVTLNGPGATANVDMVLHFGTSPLPEGEYEFEVVASDQSGQREDRVIPGTYFNDTSGPVITNLVADHQSDQVVLTWKSDRLLGDTFEITRDGNQIVAPGYPSKSYTDPNVQPGSTHLYCVCGTDYLGNAGACACKTANDPCVVPPTVSVDPMSIAVTTPQGSGTLASYTVSVTNNNPASCDNFPYAVQAPANPAPNYNLLSGSISVAPGATETTPLSVAYFNPQDPFEPPTQAHITFTVTATDPHGFFSSVPGVSFIYDLTNPGPVQNATACLAGGEVTLSWGAASDNLGISHYDVHGPSGLLGSTSSLTFTDTAPDPGDLNYQVYAVDLAGRTSTAQAAGTSAPTLTMNLLEPSPTNSASPAFSVTVQNNNPGSCADVTFALSGVPGSGHTVTVDPSLTIASGASDDAGGTVNTSQDGTHAFQVDVDGELVGGTYVVDTVSPTQPSNLFGGQGPGIAFFSWDASKDPGGTGVVGYRIDRDGSYLTTVTGLTYQDNNAPASRPLTYTVRGIDAAGNLSAPSGITFY